MAMSSQVREAGAEAREERRDGLRGRREEGWTVEDGAKSVRLW